MLSRISCKSGLIRQALVQPSLNSVAVISVRNKTFIPTPIEEHIKNWDAANEKYFGPERDHVNFPHVPQALASPPVRLGWIPESWFSCLYDKLGATGPYTLGVGLMTFLLSKELWVFEEHMAEFTGFCIAALIIHKNFGHGIAGYMDKKIDAYHEAAYIAPIADAKATATAVITEAETSIAQMAAAKFLFEAKKENIALQLEELYRKRLAEVHNAVKARLDYQVALQDSQLQLQKEFMVKWIVESVHQSITPEQEEETMRQCLSDLKLLAA